QFDFMCDQTLNIGPAAKAGNIKAYAVTTRERLAAFPGLPTAPGAGPPRLRDHGVVCDVRPERHAAADHRRAVEGAPACARRSGREEPLRRLGRPDRGGGA